MSHLHESSHIAHLGLFDAVRSKGLLNKHVSFGLDTVFDHLVDQGEDWPIEFSRRDRTVASACPPLAMLNFDQVPQGPHGWVITVRYGSSAAMSLWTRVSAEGLVASYGELDESSGMPTIIPNSTAAKVSPICPAKICLIQTLRTGGR